MPARAGVPNLLRDVPPHRMNAPKVRLPFLILLAGAAALTVAAGLMLFSTFMLYDDEGYVLLSLRNFAEHGRLYRDVYTQYGPLPYVLYYGLHLLGLPFTHTAGRLVTLLAWSGSATLVAWLVWRATRHSALMLAVLAGAFVYLWVMVSEPNHPGGLIALLTAILAAYGYRWLEAGQWTRWAALAGAGAAALALAKINVGVFATLSAVAVLLYHTGTERWRRLVPWIVATGLVVLPFGLMRPLLGAPWVQTYALIFAFAAIPVAFALAAGAGPLPGPAPRHSPWLVAVAAGLAVTVVVLGVVVLRGTTPAELVEGMILGPLHHPGHFSLEFHWPPGALTVGSISLAGFLLLQASLRLGWLRRVSVDSLVGLLRLAAAAALGWAIWRFPEVSPDNDVFAYSLPCLWLFLWPLAGEDAAGVNARQWLGLLFLGQWLHPFPVPGSQIAWGTFLALPLAAIGAWQATGWLAGRHGQPSTIGRLQRMDVMLTLLLAALAVFTGDRLARIGSRYFDSRPLDLAGAETLRLPDSTTALYRLLVLNATVHGDMLFSLPGMFSFNLWSQQPTPTLANVTHWFSLLDDDQQDAIIASLAAHPRACVIVQAGHLDFLRQRHLTPGGKLYDYVMSHYETAFEIDGFQFRVAKGRRIAPLFTAEIFGSKAAGPGVADTLVKLDVLLAPGQEIGSIALTAMDEARPAPLVLSRANTRVEVTPIDLSGQPRGPTMAAAFPFAPGGAAEISLYFNRAGAGFSTARTFLVIRDPAGAELALVRLRP
ncbi:MAG: hypothetical protein JSR48_12955 [Verrucomicrobia bacterium]|nr:hypothetical protein [Verrucomicrobiota bacterium]